MSTYNPLEGSKPRTRSNELPCGCCCCCFWSDRCSSRTILEHAARTFHTMVSYDFSMFVPILQVLVSTAGYADAASSIATMQNLLMLMVVSMMIPSTFILAPLSGALATLEARYAALVAVREPFNLQARGTGFNIPQLDKNWLTAPGADQRLADLRDTTWIPDAVPSRDQTASLWHTAVQRLVDELQTIRDTMRPVQRNICITGAIASIPTIVCLLFTRQLLQLFSQPEIVAVHAALLQLTAIGTFAFICFRMTSELLLLCMRLASKTMPMALTGLAISVGCSVLMSHVLPHRMTGFGAGESIGLSAVATMFTVYALWRFKEYRLLHNCLRFRRSDATQILQFLKQGLAIAASNCSDFVAFFACSMVAGASGLPNALQYQTFYSTILSLNVLFNCAAGQTGQIMVGSCAAQGKAKVRAIIGAALTSHLLIYVAPIVVATLAIPQPIMHALNLQLELEDNRTVVAYAMLTAGMLLVDATRYHLAQIVRAVGDVTVGPLVASAVLCLGVLLSFGLANYTSVGVVGIPLGMLVSAIGSTAVLVYRLLPRIRDDPAVAGPVALEPIAAESVKVSVSGMFEADLAALHQAFRLNIRCNLIPAFPASD